MATNESEQSQPILSKHFVLIHGACHGAWSWYKLVALLRSSGHKVTALDLAGAGVNPMQVNDLPLISDYFQPLMDFMASLPPDERVVLVAHSYGGVAISKAMESFPEKIYVAVFVTAFMPGPTLNFSTFYQEWSRRVDSDLQESNQFIFEGPNNLPIAMAFGSLYSSKNLYQLSPIEDLTLATLLMRPCRLYDKEDVSNMLVLSTKNYGSVSRVFIVAGEDKILEKDFQQWMIKQNPPDEVIEIENSDHMVMVCKPNELLVSLQAIAEKYS